MSEKRRCKAIKAGGGRCSARAQAGQDYCFAHAPDRADERRKNAAAGGKARSRRSPDELEKLKREIRSVTGLVLNGQIDRATGAIVLQGFNTLLRAIESQRKLDRIRELEADVDDLRARLQEVRQRRWGT